MHIVPARKPAHPATRTRGVGRSGPRHVVFPPKRRAAAWLAALLLPVILTASLLPRLASLQLAGMLLCNLLAVVAVALLGGSRPAILATAVAFVMSDFFFAPPFYSLRVGRVVDLIALVTFVVVAGAVGYLVDLLAREGVRTAHTSAISQNLLSFGGGQPDPYRAGRVGDRLRPADLWSRRRECPAFGTSTRGESRPPSGRRPW